MRNFLGLSTLLFSTAAFPQSFATGVVAVAAPPSTGCPVGLSARHAADGALVAIDRASKSLEHAYRISFQPGDTKSIVGAKITLRGLAGPQVMPTNVQPEANARETFTVSPAAQPHHLYDTVVYPERITGVQWIELNEVVFKDGSKWRESETTKCRVAPNGFMLVAEGAQKR